MLTLTAQTDVVISYPDNPANRILRFSLSTRAMELVTPYLSALAQNAGVSVQATHDSSQPCVEISAVYDIRRVAHDIAKGIEDEFGLSVSLISRNIITDLSVTKGG